MPDDTEKIIIDFDRQSQPFRSMQSSEHLKDSSLEMKGEIWMATSDHNGLGSRIPFTREEKEFLCELIQKHVYSKLTGPPEMEQTIQTDANGRRIISSPFCRVPNAAWKIIEEEFNAEENVRKRSSKQLRKCWENLKHRGKINPEALYSGKRLQASTSVTGGFTLSTADEEDHEIGVISPRGDTSTSPPVSDCNDESITIVKVSPQQPRNLSMNSNECAHNLVRNEMNDHRPSVQNHQPMTSPPPFVTSPMMTSSGSSMVTPRISSVRTVRSLKPNTDPLRRRYAHSGKVSRVNASRAMSNLALAGKSHAQKIHEMKVKLLAARIREHEANADKVTLQMRQAQAHHDIVMRMLRSKAAWYEANLRQLGMQLQNGDFSLVGEEEDEFPQNISDDEEMEYGLEYA